MTIPPEPFLPTTSCVEETPVSMGEALTAATRRLAAAGVEGPRAEARRLLGAVTGLSRERLLATPEAPLAPAAAAEYERAVARRAAREPFAYVIGRREFYGRELTVRPGVLVPRPETETLVEVVLRRFPDQGAALRVLDLGVGSGCLVVTLLALYPNARGVGTDVSETALAVTRENALSASVANRLGLLRTDWGAALAPSFDLIVSNPPYIATADLAVLQPEVAAHEPALALDGGADGLAAYRALTPDLRRLLGPAGVALLEIGQGQEAPLAAWLEAQGLTVRACWPDLAGIPRCLELARRG